MDKEGGQAHPFDLNTEKTIHCSDVNFVMPAFQKRSDHYVVLKHRVGNFPILSIMTFWLSKH